MQSRRNNKLRQAKEKQSEKNLAIDLSKVPKEDHESNPSSREGSQDGEKRESRMGKNRGQSQLSKHTRRTNSSMKSK